MNPFRLPVARVRLGVLGALAAAAPPTLCAQCQTTLSSGGPIAILSGAVRALQSWDPDGAGPAAPVLVAGGTLLTAGWQMQRLLLVHDGSQWTDLGLPGSGAAAGSVQALAVWNGELIAAGAFSFVTTTGDTAENIARWDGSAWRRLGMGVDGPVHALAVHNGELIVAGSFAQAGGAARPGIARWSGTSWNGLGTGLAGTPRALASFAGALYVGGQLTGAGGTTVANLARWNGTAWSAAGDPDGEVRALAVRTGASLAGSSLFATGAFANIGGVAANRVAALNGASLVWSALGGGLPATGVSLAVRATGMSTFEVAAGVDSPGNTQRVWRWSGSSWTNLGGIAQGSTPLLPRALAVHGGAFTVGLDPAAQAVRAWNGTVWAPLAGRGVPDAVRAVTWHGTSLVAGGGFAAIDGVVVNGIARRAGTVWQELGGGVQGGGAAVFALARLPNGDLVAGGDFTAAGGVPADNVARWDGSVWSPLASGVDGPVHALLPLPDGGIVAGGAFVTAGGVAANRVARFDGVAWQPLGAGVDAAVLALALSPSGHVYAGGEFTSAGGVPAARIARWTGSAWTAIGAGFDDRVRAIVALGDLDLVAGGDFTQTGGTGVAGVARFDGASWSPLGQSALFTSVRALLRLPDGDLLAAGNAGQPGGTAARLARWDGSVWSLPGSGLQGRDAHALAAAPAGNIAIGGAFEVANGVAAGNLAQLASDCPAGASAHGAPCPGTVGLPTLSAAALPWIGGTYEARTTAPLLTPLTLGLNVIGEVPVALSLAPLLPPADAACTLYTVPFQIDLLLPGTGGLGWSTAVPPVSTLVGAQVHQQTLLLSYDPALNPIGVAASNALLLTIGVF